MTFIKIFNKNEKREIMNKLNKQFGIKKVEGILLKRGAERIFLFEGDLKEKEIKKLEYSRINIERVGVYFGKLQNNEIRLSIEGVHLLKDQITKNIFRINEEQKEEWMKGHELNIKSEKKGFLVIKYKDDFLGCGKASSEKISNFIPKNRRLKEKN